MNLRKGIVVGVHPEDHSVDLVMADDGSRLVGIQVMTNNGSTRSGNVDLPHFEEPEAGKSRWDVSSRTEQDMQALVGYVGGRNPVVVGFLYPQVNQMLLKDGKTKRYRHQSDVEFSIDGDANIQLRHPNGAYVRIGEDPDASEYGENIVDNSETDRNIDKEVYIRVALPGDKAVLTIEPSGKVRLETKGEIFVRSDKDVNVEAKTATVKADKVTLDTPETMCTGNLAVTGSITFGAGISGTGKGGGVAMTIRGDVGIEGRVAVNGSMDVSGDLLNGGENSPNHEH